MRFAELPELTIMPHFLPKLSATFFSNSAVIGPGASQPCRRHLPTAKISSSPKASNLFGAYLQGNERHTLIWRIPRRKGTHGDWSSPNASNLFGAYLQGKGHMVTGLPRTLQTYLARTYKERKGTHCQTYLARTYNERRTWSLRCRLYRLITVS